MTDQLPVALLRPSHIRVLLVPIHPIRKDTFRQYVDTISEFAVVSTSDLTKPDSTKATSKFSQQMYEHDGYLHMNYVTFYDKDHAPLEEMQPWRQIVAVVGVMHCQQVTSIGEGGKRFQSILNRYPAVLASRCFAFEPTEQQADDTRGCIMIPDDPKKLSFYLQTQINDLANELLVAFGNMAAHAEKRPMINGPLLTSPLILPLSTSAAPSPIGNIASPSALHAAQSATSIIPSPHGASLPSAGVREASAPTLMPQDSASSMLGNIFAPDKTKKRTPARAQKIVGDLFLLAGRLDLAISSYSTALEAMKAMADYQWQACTMESYYCALLLSLLSKTGAWPPPENNDNASFMSEDNALPALFTRQPLKPPTYATLFEAARINAQFRALICDIPERYREIVTLYEKACAPGQQGYYPHFQTQACLTIAKFLAAMWLNKFNGPITGGAGILLYTPESKGIADIATNMGLQPARQAGASASGGMGSSGPASDKDRIVLNGGLGCSRVDVSSWAMKAWGLGIEYLTLSDQIRCVTGITTAYALVGLRKKHAFFLRQTALLLAANLRGPQRARMGSLPDIAEAPDVKVGRATVTARGGPLESGSLLECMDIVCKAYGAGQLGGAADVDAPMALYDDENDDWVDAYFDESDLDLSSIDDPGAHRYIRPSAPLTRVRYGWPDLQISVLKETIEMAETVGAQAALVNAALRLLHRLHRNLSENEQHDVLDTLEAALGPQISLPSGSSTCRVPVLRRVEVLRQGLTEVPYPHPRGLLSGKVTAAADEKKDPFLYNPFADKGKSAKRDLGRSVLLVAGELAFFDVTFANPFLFDLDVDDLALHTSGVAFDPVPRPSAPIPAHARAHTIRLAGTPRESGTLEIRGVSARLFGGLRVEIECLSRLIENPKVRTKDGHRRPQDETARFGKRVTDLKPASKGDDAPLPPWSIPISVIPAQPVLQIVKDATGGGAQASRMLFAGERTAFPLRLENIGQTVVDFVTVGMLESYVEPAPGAAGAEMALEEPEDVYERDVHWRSVRALWVEKDPRRTAGSGGGGLAGGPPVLGEAVVERLDMRLAPGESADVWIGVFGKLGCTGGTITVSYASTDASPPDSPTFHTRVLVQPVHVTVTRSLHPLTMDVLLLTDRRDFIGSTEEGAGGQHRDMSLEELTVDVGGEEDEREDSEKRQKDDYCLFVLDLRNFWRGVFEVVFEVFDDPESVVPSYETRTVIHSGVTKRIHLPVRRLLLPASQASQRIPEPSWKQFVVGKTRKRAPREEHARRTWFWYREELLRRVRVRWHASGNRAGTVPLRALKLGPEMGAALRQQRVAVDVDVAGKAAAGPTRWTLKVWEEVTLVWTVRNMTDRQLLPLLRVLPTRNPPPLTSGATPAITTSSSPAGVSLSPRQVSAAATNVIPAAPLTAVLPPVPPGSSVSHTLPLLATGSGAVCFLWTVEDLDAADAAAGEGAWCGGEDAVLTVI
ncbi:TRAPP II complex [Geranomyces variabilis]|nr:TRAPP II complex [Geranomyces variabilis]KAJ3142253.1 hypothetical protein HDU90_004526 [Geranomyces variabilis]